MKLAWMIVGTISTLAGAIWTLQGVGLLQGSTLMSGKPIWALIGPVVAILGVVAVYFGARRTDAS